MQRTSLVFCLLVLALAACGTKKASPDGGAGGTGADAGSIAGSTGAMAGAGGSGLAGTTGVAGNGGGGASATGGAGQGDAGTGGAGQGTAGAAGAGVAGQGAAGAAGTGVAGQGAAGATAGGSSGAAGAGAGAGGAGGAGDGFDCLLKSDCMLASDCCSCRAEPKGKPVDSCPAACAVDVCRANEIEQNEVACVLGRCVLTRSCDTTRVTCLADPPACPAGTVPSVRDSCWGPCLLPTECRAVNNCGSCGAGSVCVRSQQIGTVCATPASDCRAGNYCHCLFVDCPICTEADAGVQCVCPGC
jgi:hypothetical protein